MVGHPKLLNAWLNPWPRNTARWTGGSGRVLSIQDKGDYHCSHRGGILRPRSLYSKCKYNLIWSNFRRECKYPNPIYSPVSKMYSSCKSYIGIYGNASRKQGWYGAMHEDIYPPTFPVLRYVLIYSAIPILYNLLLLYILIYSGCTIHDLWIIDWPGSFRFMKSYIFLAGIVTNTGLLLVFILM